MSTKKYAKQNYFWPSYTDLMTSLFFIMLVLYVLTYLYMRAEQERFRIKVALYERIKKTEDDVQALNKQGHFQWDKSYKRLQLSRHIEFFVGKATLREEDLPFLLEAGRDIKRLVENAKKRDAQAKLDVRYLIIIEGMASNDGYSKNDELSYNRALDVFHLWKRNGLLPDEKACEVIISGSGTGGVGRFPPVMEFKNQRILVQIIPKIYESQ